MNYQTILEYWARITSHNFYGWTLRTKSHRNVHKCLQKNLYFGCASGTLKVGTWTKYEQYQLLGEFMVFDQLILHFINSFVWTLNGSICAKFFGCATKCCLEITSVCCEYSKIYWIRNRIKNKRTCSICSAIKVTWNTT